MSWGNYKSPTKPTCEPKYIVEYGKYGKVSLNEEQKAEFIRLYPRTENIKIMELFGLSASTMERLRREYGVEKDKAYFAKLRTRRAKRTCEKNGYYDSLKGCKPSPQCIEATRKKRAEGFTPINALKEKHPRKYKNLMKKRSEARKALIASERRRYELGLSQRTDFPTHLLDDAKMSTQEVSLRYLARKKGYEVGSIIREKCERYVIFYTDSTPRNLAYEERLKAKGYEVKPKNRKETIYVREID